MPAISIIIPIYNTAPYLPDTLNSVLSQTFQDFEVVLIDDGSTDHSAQVADALMAPSGVSYTLIRQQNKGNAAARNAGMEQAQGRWLLFLDSDDLLAPDLLARYMTLLEERSDVQLLFSDFRMVCSGTIPNPLPYEKGHEWLSGQAAQEAFLLRKTIVLAPGTLFEASWLKACGVHFRDLFFMEDALFVWEALLHATLIGHIKAPLYSYLVRPGSVMTSTAYDKILTAIPAFKALQVRLSGWPGISALTRRSLYARWVFGLMRSAATLCTRREYQELGLRAGARPSMTALLHFPDGRVRLMSRLYLFSNTLFYWFNRALFRTFRQRH